MTDDQDMALNEQTEVETVEDTTPVSEETAPVDSTTEEESKKGATARVREAVNKANRAEQEAQSLRAKLAELTGQVGQQEFNTPQQPQKPLVNPGEEVTIEELNRRQEERETQLLQRAGQMSQIQAQQALAIERINREARDLTRKYAELDPNNDNFDRELSDAVTEAGMAFVRANPTKSLEDFVDKQMKVYKRAATKEARAENAEVSKQQGQTAIRPSVAKPVEKKFEDLTLEEMEAQLGMVEP